MPDTLSLELPVGFSYAQKEQEIRLREALSYLSPKSTPKCTKPEYKRPNLASRNIVIKMASMTLLLGVARLGLIAFVLSVGLLIVLLTALLPFRIRGHRPPALVVQNLACIFNIIFNVRVRCTDVAKLRQHSGFIFPNHVSYLEPVALFSLMPMRFLGAIEVRQRPLVGQLAAAVGTVFVKREDRRSRDAARAMIIAAMQAEPDPSLVLFPEGKLGPGDRLNPFRYGAFEMATSNAISFMPVAIRYDRTDVIVWYGGSGESLLSALWRLATFPGPVHVEVVPLDAVTPTVQDDAKLHAESTERSVAHALGFVDSL